jgi:hypothetical protein
MGFLDRRAEGCRTRRCRLGELQLHMIRRLDLVPGLVRQSRCVIFALCIESQSHLCCSKLNAD